MLFQQVGFDSVVDFLDIFFESHFLFLRGWNLQKKNPTNIEGAREREFGFFIFLQRAHSIGGSRAGLNRKAGEGFYLKYFREFQRPGLCVLYFFTSPGCMKPRSTATRIVTPIILSAGQRVAMPGVVEAVPCVSCAAAVQSNFIDREISIIPGPGVWGLAKGINVYVSVRLSIVFLPHSSTR